MVGTDAAPPVRAYRDSAMKRPAPFLLLNRFGNPLVAGILRSRAHPLLSRHLIVIELAGRRSHRRFSLPVGYEQLDPLTLRVTVGAPQAKVWWRNLTEPAPVVVQLRGSRREALGHVERDGDSVHVILELTDAQGPGHA